MAGVLVSVSAGNDGPYCNSLGAPAMNDITFSVGAINKLSSIARFSLRGPQLKLDFETAEDPSPGPGQCRTKCFAYFGQNGWGMGQELCTLTKPDITAPGVNINSSISNSNNSYAVRSGTSMAAPVLTGNMALMVCAYKEKHGDDAKLAISSAFKIIKDTASRERIDLFEGHGEDSSKKFAKASNLMCNVAYGQRCGSYPNNVYGYGELDACAAVKAVKNL